MTTRQTTLGGSEVAIVLPGTWAGIPVDDQEAADRRIKALVKNQVGRNDRLASVRRDVREQLKTLVADARRSRAFAFALALEILPGVPFPVSMLMIRDEWPGGTTGLESDASREFLDDRLATAYPRAERVETSIGTVLRESEVHDVQYTEESAPQLTLDYRFAPPARDCVIRVHITAPMARFPDLYTELFDAIIDSIEFRDPVPSASTTA